MGAGQGAAALVSLKRADNPSPSANKGVEPRHPGGGDNVATTLRVLRRELSARAGRSRSLRQQLTQSVADAFEEPRRQPRGRQAVSAYGSAAALRYPADDTRHYMNLLPQSSAYEAAAHTGETARLREVPDAAFADLERACQQAGPGHEWDAARHECLFAPFPGATPRAPEAELPRGRGVTQEGPSRQAIDGGPVAGEPCVGDDVDEFGACRPRPEGQVDQDGWRPGDPSRNGFKNPYDPASEWQQRGRREHLAQRIVVLGIQQWLGPLSIVGFSLIFSSDCPFKRFLKCRIKSR